MTDTAAPIRSWLLGREAEPTTDAPTFRGAQIASFARQTPINSLVTLANSMLVTATLWPAMPIPWLALWCVAQTVLPSFLLYRWWRRRNRPSKPVASERAVRRARWFALVSGSLWGSTAFFLPLLPAEHRLALSLVVGAMAAGASTTLAAVPEAAAAFILAAILPTVIYFAIQGDALHLGLAAMALIMAMAMLASTRIVYGAFIDELAAREENKRLLSAIKSERQEWLDISDSAEAFALYDADDRLLLWNENYRRFLSIEPGLLARGAPRANIMSHAAKPVGGTDSRATGEPSTLPASDVETAPELAAVQQYANGRWLRGSTRRTAAGHSVAIYVDVSRLKGRERTLLATQRKLEVQSAELSAAYAKLDAANRALSLFIESSPLPTVTFDLDGNVTSWNSASMRLFGYSRDDVIGRPPPFITEDTAQEFRANFRRVLTSDLPIEFDIRRRRMDGSSVDARALSSAIRDEGAAVRGIVTIYVDRTDTKRIEEQLRQAQRMESIGQLAGGIAHDFNNLLGVVVGNLDLLETRVSNAELEHNLLNDARSAALRGAELAKQLLAFSRRQPLTPKPTDVNQVVSAMAAMLDRTLRQNIDVRLTVDPHPILAVVDTTLLEVAILNLAVNARDAMPDGGIVTIATRKVSVDAATAAAYPSARPGDFVAVTVADTGHGMSPTVLARAFEPFFTTKDVGRGSGLGLSTVYGFATQSGGFATIESRPNRGTAVTLYLPAANAEAAREPAPSAPVAAVPVGETTILVVEDDPRLRQVVVRQLNDLGYATIDVASGADALAEIEGGRRIDLLFADVLIPGGIDGWTLARRATSLRPEIKVLMTSGYSDPSGAPAPAAEAGLRMLPKPYRKHELAAALRALFDFA